MKSAILFCAAALASLAGPAQGGDLADGFRAPPPDARPQVWWHWMNGNVSKPGITADLESMAEVGIGGAQVFDVGCGIPPGPVRFGTDDWFDHVLWAHREAQRLGLKLTVANCSGYSSSGGPWVKPEDSMKYLVWTETEVAGGTAFDGILPAPENPHGFYEDLAVCAVKVPAGSRRGLKDGGGRVIRTEADGARTSVFTFDFPRPWAAREVSYRALAATVSWNSSMKAKVEASDDGRAWRTLCDRTVPFCYGGERCDLPRELDFPATTALHYRVSFSRSSPADERIEDVDVGSFARLGDLGVRTLRIRNRGELSSREVPADAVIAPKDVIDLTASFDRATGRLRWTVPEGRWTLLRVGDAANGETCRPATPGGVGLEVDKFSRAALVRHFDAYMGRLARLCEIDPKSDPAKRTGLVSALVDSYEAGGQNWGTGFAEAFEAQCGYSALGAFLPVLTGRVIGSVERSERFLADYRRVIGELFAENYADCYVDCCRRAGLLAAIECYGDEPACDLRYGRNVPLPMCEFWLHPGQVFEYDDDDIPMAASLAHMWGRRFVGAEAFTTMPDEAGWRQAPFHYKAQGDVCYALGVNRMIYHRFAHQPWANPTRWPGMTMGPWGTHFERTETWWRQSADWLKYQARCQHLLQEGVAAPDYLRYCGEEVPESGYAARSLSERDYRAPVAAKGYRFDLCELGALEKIVRVRKDGSLVSPGGTRYRFLALPPRAAMSPRALATVQRLAALGANIAGRPPVRAFGLVDASADASVRSRAAAVWEKHPNVRDEDEASAAARLLGAPDFTADDPCVRFCHRRYGDGTDGYFVACPAATALTVRCSFRTTGRAPELWDAETGEIRRADAWRVRDGRTEVVLRFRPAGSVFVMFTVRPTAGLLPAEGELKPVATAEVKGPWRVTFPVGWNTPTPRAVERETEPADWSKDAANEIRFFSGTATYERTLECPPGAGEKGVRTFLDLGRVGEIAEVEVDGVKLPCLWRPPYRTEITAAIAGKAKCAVKVKVTNLWINRLVGDAVEFPHDSTWSGAELKEIPEFVKEGRPSPTGRSTFTTWRHWYKSNVRDIPPSGLMGPVRILLMRPHGQD